MNTLLSSSCIPLFQNANKSWGQKVNLIKVLSVLCRCFTDSQLSSSRSCFLPQVQNKLFQIQLVPFLFHQDPRSTVSTEIPNFWMPTRRKHIPQHGFYRYHVLSGSWAQFKKDPNEKSPFLTKKKKEEEEGKKVKGQCFQVQIKPLKNAWCKHFFFKWRSEDGDDQLYELSQHWQHDVDSYCQVQPRDGAEEQHSPDKPLLLLWFGQNFKSRQLVSHRISRRFTRMFCSCRDNHFGTNRISSREGLHQSQISVPKKTILKMLTFFFFLNYRLVSLNCFFKALM